MNTFTQARTLTLSRRPTVQNNVYFATIVIFGLFLLLEGYSSDNFRYLKYTLPVFPLMIQISGGNVSLKNDYLKGMLAFLLTFFLFQCALTVVGLMPYNNRFFSEFFFMLAPFFTVALLDNEGIVAQTEKYLTVLFYFVVAAFLVEAFTKGLIGNFFRLSLSELKEQLIMSDAGMESVQSFNFGMFAIFFFFKKRRTHSFAALIFLVLSLKRIALAGVCLAAAFYFLYRLAFLRRYFFFILVTTVIGLNVVVPYIQIALTTGVFDDMVDKSLGISTDNFLQGRQEIYQLLIEKFKHPTFLGTGIGSLNAFLRSLGDDFDNVHSDLLKNVYEMGFVFYASWIILIYRKLILRKNLPCICLALYLNVVFMTDNVVIYFSIILIFCLMIANFLAEADKRTADASC